MKKKHYVLTGEMSKIFLISGIIQEEIEEANIIKNMFGLPVAIDFGYLGYFKSLKIAFKVGQIIGDFSTINPDTDIKWMVEIQWVGHMPFSFRDQNTYYNGLKVRKLYF